MNKLEKIEKSKINDQFQTGIDLLICVSSFEDRCTSFALSLNPSLVKDVVLLDVYKRQIISGVSITRSEKNLPGTLSHVLPLLTIGGIR